MNSEDVNLIQKTIKWIRQAEIAIREAGGHPQHLIDKMPVDLLEILIRNDISLLYLPYTKEG